MEIILHLTSFKNNNKIIVHLYHYQYLFWIVYIDVYETQVSEDKVYSLITSWIFLFTQGNIYIQSLGWVGVGSHIDLIKV